MISYTSSIPLSPLLSNIVLEELDKELEKRGLNFVRYADDFVIYLKSRKAAVRVMSSITKFITNKLKLKINEEGRRRGAKVLSAVRGCANFLGLLLSVCVARQRFGFTRRQLSALRKESGN